MNHVQDWQQDSNDDALPWLRIILFGILAVLLIAAITLGGWQVGWWFNAQNTNRQSVIDQQNYGSQLAYITKVGNNITEETNVELQIAQPGIAADQKTALTNEQIALVADTCRMGRLITNPPADQAAWIHAHC
jgi:hypothetical protein